MKTLLTAAALGLSLCAFTALHCAAQEHPKRPPHVSPRLAALQTQLEAGNRAALRSFWQEVAKEGTPLIETIPGDDKHVLVTFLWRGAEDTKNVVVFSVLGVLWSYSGNQLAQNQMTHMTDTDLWYKTYLVRKDARFTYYLSPNDALLPSEARKEDKDWATWQPDPLNPHRQVRPHPDKDWISSVVELPDAPPLQPWVKPTPGVPAGHLNVHRLSSKILGNERRIWVYTAPGYKPNGGPYHLLVLFDGWTYSQMIPTSTILDNLQAKAGLPPLIAVMVEHPTQKDRILELACYPPFNKFLAQELIPWIRQHYNVTSNPAQTIVGGQSRGGLAAAFAGLQHPEIFGNVLSQSGYFSWDPKEEEQQEDIEYEWVIRQYVASPKLRLRFYLSVGLLEKQHEFPDSPSLLQANRHMRDVLQAKGYSVRYNEVSAGHEIITHAATLPDGLLFLAGKDTSNKEVVRK